MSQTIPAGRMQLTNPAPRAAVAMHRLQASTELGDLVALRASQIDGCALLLDMHWWDARAADTPDPR
jgi:AhpD family alkylhydroperoxidase